MTQVIGLTGSLGSGKSSVISYFRQKNIPTIDADEISREVVEPGMKGWHDLKNAIGDMYFHENGELDRRKLRNAISHDQSLRHRVNGVLHPLVRREIRKQVAALLTFGRNVPVIVVEVPLLFEVSWEGDFDRIILVYAPPDECIKRFSVRDNVGTEAAGKFFNTQMDIDEKMGRADFVIDNSGPWSDTVKQLDEMLNTLKV